jgi:hypothetical protein
MEAFLDTLADPNQAGPGRAGTTSTYPRKRPYLTDRASCSSGEEVPTEVAVGVSGVLALSVAIGVANSDNTSSPATTTAPPATPIPA